MIYALHPQRRVAVLPGEQPVGLDELLDVVAVAQVGAVEDVLVAEAGAAVAREDLVLNGDDRERFKKLNEIHRKRRTFFIKDRTLRLDLMLSTSTYIPFGTFHLRTSHNCIIGSAISCTQYMLRIFTLLINRCLNIPAAHAATP